MGLVISITMSKFLKMVSEVNENYLNMQGSVKMKHSAQKSTVDAQQNPNATQDSNVPDEDDSPILKSLVLKASEMDGPDGADELDEYLKSLGVDKKKLGGTFLELSNRYNNNA